MWWPVILMQQPACCRVSVAGGLGSLSFALFCLLVGALHLAEDKKEKKEKKDTEAEPALRQSREAINEALLKSGK
jgi:hypothetical protein